MDSLTFDGNFCDIAQCIEICGGDCCSDGYCSQRKVWERLKQYEDTGLEPGAISQLKKVPEIFNCDASDPAQLKQILLKLQSCAEAERSGRLVVLPCKVGDTVYVIGNSRIVECCIDEAYLDDINGLEYLVSFDCDSDCDGCPFDDWSQDFSGEYSCSGEYGQASINGSDIGKTVFLTREEAEAALEAQKGSDKNK